MGTVILCFDRPKQGLPAIHELNLRACSYANLTATTSAGTLAVQKASVCLVNASGPLV